MPDAALIELKQTENRRTVTVPRAGRVTRGRYDAAQPNRDNDRHWGNTDQLDAVQANSAVARARLRRRARYEAANNCYARGMIETRADDMVGIGPRLQMLTNSEDFNNELERRFTQWADAIDLPGKLRTMRKARIHDGEAFLMPFTNDDLMLDEVETSLVKLDFRPIEADQIESPALSRLKYTEGIRFNEQGVPIAYSVLKQHPGGLLAGSGFDEIPRKRMIHWFRSDRAGQIRGVPEMTPAITLYAQLRRYTLAVLTSAELLAEFTLFMKTSAGSIDQAARLTTSESGGTEVSFQAIDVERGMLTFLPDGWEPWQVKSEQPSATYEMFKTQVLNEIARCLNIPYNVAAGNSSGYNYASGRLDHKTYYRTLRVEQNDCERRVLNHIFALWLEEASLIWGIRSKRLPHAWFWVRDEHVDPAKEAKAQATRLKSHTTTLAAEYAAIGRDWREELKQIGAERALMRELGIPNDDGIGKSDTTSPSGAEDDEEKEERDE